MKGARQKYIEHVVRKLTKLVKEVGVYLLLPDADDVVEEKFQEVKKTIDELHNQYHDN